MIIEYNNNEINCNGFYGNAQKLYNGAVTQKTSVEDANVLGARLMREAKVSSSLLLILILVSNVS